MGLIEAEDPFRTDLIRWATVNVPSIMVEEDMRLLRESYRISNDIGLMIPEPNERAYFPRKRVYCPTSTFFCRWDASAFALHFLKEFCVRMAWHRCRWLQMDGVRWLGVYTCGLGIHLVSKFLCTYSRPCTTSGNYRRRKARMKNSTGITSTPGGLISL
ncbi:Uncharacterized protein Adt_16500 [Abeliophyllum distichum]|uniref:Uncharacterized protein n=1 Tax=Abeliophyllum distichum TaxID=126358 RepID=A0ABD1TDV8_9LAMI